MVHFMFEYPTNYSFDVRDYVEIFYWKIHDLLLFFSDNTFFIAIFTIIVLTGVVGLIRSFFRRAY